MSAADSSPYRQPLPTPRADRAVLSVPEARRSPTLIADNRQQLRKARVELDGSSLAEFQDQARAEVLSLVAPERWYDPEQPWLLAGHQPELVHPGVWAKNFALAGLARSVNGVSLNLVVDNDTVKLPRILLPSWSGRKPSDEPSSVRLAPIRFDRLAGPLAYERRRVCDQDLFASVTEQAEAICRNWGYTPLLMEEWPRMVADPAESIGEKFHNARCRRERFWGCDNFELSVSRMSQTEAFRRFFRHVTDHAHEFRLVYNQAIRDYRQRHRLRSDNHPAPLLDEGELPFWRIEENGRRQPVFAASSGWDKSELDRLRPKAISLTLFARLVLADWFIHGIGGGKYDEVTDQILARFFGIGPLGFQVVSAALHLPLPKPAPPTPDSQQLELLQRDWFWNPQRHLPPALQGEPEVELLVADHRRLCDWQPADRAGRRARATSFADLRQQLSRRVTGQEEFVEKIARAKSIEKARQRLSRRDFAWILYPETELKDFLCQFLEAGDGFGIGKV